MSHDHTLYDEDILLWSEQQAELIRALGRRPDLPNAFDPENVAEEIESVGRSELAAVKSQIRSILVHLAKLVLEPGSDATRHWAAEIVTFHSELTDRYAASMRQRIDLDALWRSAREQLSLAYQGTEQQARVAALPVAAPIGLDDLLAAPIAVAALVDRVRGADA